MPNPPEVWDGVLRRLGTELPAQSLDAWLGRLEVRLDGDGMLLLCPTPFHVDRVRERFLPRLAELAAGIEGRSVAIRVDLAPAGRACAATAEPASRVVAPLPAAPRAQPDSPAQADAERRPPPRPRQYTFDTFVVGRCNALAREACYAVAHDRQAGLSPLYLAAPTGFGKTHLARAAAAEAQRRGGARVLYASADSFTHQFTTSLRAKNTAQLKRRFRDECDLLVFEDVQFLGGKTWTQLELFHTITHLLDAGRRVILTGDRLPRDIERLDPRLRARMASGLVAEMESPAAQVRREILCSKAAAGGVRLPAECLDRLVEAVRGSVRDLDSVLIQLVSTASLLKRPIDLELTERALHKLWPSRSEPRALRPESVVKAVATFFGTTPSALASRSRRRDVLVPRQLAMYLCRRHTGASLAEIGRAVGRDHPAVANAVGAIERAVLERAPLRYQVEALCERLDSMRERGSPSD